MGERRWNLPALRGERATAFNQECFMCHIEKASKRRFEAITAKKGGNARPFQQAPPIAALRADESRERQTLF